MEFTINNLSLNEIAKWCNEKLDRETIEEYFDLEYYNHNKVEEEDVVEFLKWAVEDMLDRCLNFEFGVDV